MTAGELTKRLNSLGDPKRAKASQWFFKTGEGQYGAGDKFIGVTMLANRAVCKKYKDLNLSEIEKLLENDVHEVRMAGLVIMTDQAKKADQELKKTYTIYIFAEPTISITGI